ncbi:MAG: NAD-dependent epimerase/dehydratase family protein [Gammaproteobacteria bacterium]|nr:NAD-dependent epimerase/dehydratase family protein [Gammaproteobacteria bacterium]
MQNHGAGTLLATGGNGFVVSHVVRRWLERYPGGRAIVVDAAPPDSTACEFFTPLGARIDFLTGSVLDKNLWSSLEPRDDIVHVVHGAAVTSIDRLVHAEGRGRPGLAGARESIAANIDGGLNLLEFCARLPALTRLVNISSGSVYGKSGPDPLPEDGYVAPDGIYAVSKYAAECFTTWAAKDLRLPAVSIRLSGVFGPMDRQTPARTVRCAPRILAEKAIAGETVRVRSYDGAGDFVYVVDVADAILALLEPARLRFPVYNVAAGALTTIGELVDAFRTRVAALSVEEVSEGEVDIDYPPSQRYGRYGAYDISRIKADSEWRPRSLANAVADYLDWLARK